MYPYKFRKGKIINTQLDEVKDLDNPTITVELKENGLFKFKTYKTNTVLQNGFDDLNNYKLNTKVHFWTNKNKVVFFKLLNS